MIEIDGARWLSIIVVGSRRFSSGRSCLVAGTRALLIVVVHVCLDPCL